MGQRGPLREYGNVVKFSCTDSQAEFLNDLAQLQEVTVPEAVRRLVDAAFAEALLKEALRG